MPIGIVARPYPLPTSARMQAVPVTPRPIPTATGDPRQFRLELRPLSARRVEAWVLGAYKVPGYAPVEATTPTPAWHGTGIFSRGIPPIALPSNLPGPTLNEINESYALQLSVKDDRGRIAARGVPQKAGFAYGGPSPTQTFQILTFDLDRPLGQSKSPYTVMVRWRATPDVSATSRLLISTAPKNADMRVGARFIARPYGPLDVFRLSGSNDTEEGRRRIFVSESEPRTTLAIADDDDVRGIGPIVSDAGVDSLRHRYVGVPVYAKNYEFDCLDAHGWGAVAELKPGRSLRIDTISRVGDVMTWLPDDPRQRVYSFPCNGDCSKHKGVFVDSPLIVGFKLNAADTTILPQPHSVVSLFDGRCERGYAALQDPRQFDDIFSRSKP